MFQIAIDTGGTFTDAVLTDEERQVSTAKVPTNIRRPEESIMGCITLLAQECQLTEQQLLDNVASLVVGTTLATNCVLEGNGAKCCLLHTRGFRDIFELQYNIIGQVNIYNAKVAPPRALIPRSLRWAIEERTIYTGEIITSLNENDVHKAIKKAKKQGVEVPVICFLHSYANSENEERAAELIESEYPNVVVSSHILRRWLEFDRLSAATLAAYVKPKVINFATALQKQLKDSNFSGTFLFITRLGGVASPDLIEYNPALLIGSGPAAAVLLGPFLAESASFQNIIVCDMGGTSFEVSVLPERRITTTTEDVIGEWKNAVEGLDLMSIGAGGGSIAWVDEGGMLRVGPSSAGADPGPACYGKGGQLPTITDADVVLGYCPTDYFLGGSLQLDASLAKKAIQEKIAKQLNMDLIEAAHAIVSITEANMADRIYLSAVEKGYDPREFTLIIGGGAGPVHAAALAARLNMKDVYIPNHAGMFSAFGMMVADYKHVLSRLLSRMGDKVTIGELKAVYDSLEEEGVAMLKREGISERDMRFIRGAEMRYDGQIHYIEGLLPETKRGKDFTEEDRQALIELFHERHKAIYGWSDSSYPVMVETVKLQAIGARPPFRLIEQKLFGKDASGAIKRQRQAYFKELRGFVETPCYDGEQLRYGNVFAGPAIIEESNTTVVVPPGAGLTIDVYGNYIMKLR